jgi:hypothetical protein
MPSLETDAAVEIEIIPARLRAGGLTRCFAYKGPSMAPTFRPGHLLYVHPGIHGVGPGDVIVFANPSGDGYIVHRLISVADARWITRGDNNAREDRPIAPDQVVGRVDMVDARGHLKPVCGASRGLWLARTQWGTRRVGKWLRRSLSPLYRTLRDSPILHRLLEQSFARALRVVRVETPDGPLLKTLYRGKVVARWWPQLCHFECQKPFDLIIPRPDGA